MDSPLPYVTFIMEVNWSKVNRIQGGMRSLSKMLNESNKLLWRLVRTLAEIVEIQ